MKRWMKRMLPIAGLVTLATPAMFAQEGWYRDRDLRHDYGRENTIQNDIARDRARLNEDIRCGRQEAAARDAADLARDQRVLDAQYRDIRHDRRRDRDWR